MGKENSLRTHIFEIVKIHYNSNSNVLITLSSSSRKFDRSNNGNKRKKKKKLCFLYLIKNMSPDRTMLLYLESNML